MKDTFFGLRDISLHALLLWDTGTYVVSKIICRIKILWGISSRESKSKTKQTNKKTGIFNKVLWYYLAAAAALW